MDNAKILEVNQRLKRGQGWVGYRYSKSSNGEKVPSKFLYYAFYQHSTQKFSNSKTNDPEGAYRQLLDARRAITEGVRLLPSEVFRIRYEDLRTILLDYYREHKPRYITKRHTGETDSDGNKQMTCARLSSKSASSRRRPLRGLGRGRALNLGDRSAQLEAQIANVQFRWNLPFAGTYSCLCD